MVKLDYVLDVLIDLQNAGICCDGTEFLRKLSFVQAFLLALRLDISKRIRVYADGFFFATLVNYLNHVCWTLLVRVRFVLVLPRVP